VVICQKRFVDGRTYGRTDRHFRPALLGRLGGVDQVIFLHSTH